MPESFLSLVASHFLENYSTLRDDVCIIFPNRRASVFFRKELSRLSTEVQWLPDIFSTEDFVREITRQKIAEPVAQLFEFYTAYSAREEGAAETFDVFSTWATQLLHDFQEIDLYLVDAKQLFGTIDDAYAIKNWSPDGTILTANQQQYLRFWSRMGTWYSAFREQLKSKGLATAAMSYRLLAEEIEHFSEELKWKKVIFAGFNALNKAEQKIIRHLVKQGKAEILWDIDPYYLDNDQNEAGHFFRQYRRQWPIGKFKWTNSLLAETPHTIEVIGVAKNMGQAIVAGSILNKLSEKEGDLTDTALVLCDEQLLTPVLEQLPRHLEKVNITMGYPLHLLPVSSLFQLVFDLHRKARLSGKQGNKQPLFYYKDIIRLLRNPVLAAAMDPEKTQHLINRIQNDKSIFIGRNYVLAPVNGEPAALSSLQFILDAWENSVEKALTVLEKFVEFIRETLSANQTASEGLDLEALFSVSKLITRISQWKKDFAGFDSLKTLQRIFSQLLKQQSLPFFGEPLTGLQLMGLLETRNLDFKNLILLSVNEGILPAAKMNRSFIPNDIANAFGLPTYKERDAIFGYHFYRMLQRAENVWLVYNTETDEFGKGEQSRFITQLEEELKSPLVTINRKTYVPDLPGMREQKIEVTKTPDLMKRLKLRISGADEYKRLSPSALSRYVNCSLSYYFKYLSGINVETIKNEDIGSDVLGSVVHAVLEDFYKPLEGQYLNAQHIRRMQLALSEKVREKFLLKVDAEDLDFGKNFLIYKGAEKMLGNFLDQELLQLEQLEAGGGTLKLEQIESSLEKTIDVETQEGMQKVAFGGNADRIDRLNGVLRVLDYKTGFVDEKSLKLDGFDEIVSDPAKAKALQLMQYALMVRDEKNPESVVEPGIISLRKPSLGVLGLTFNKEHGISDSAQPELQQVFRSIAEELLDPELPFEQTDDLARCAFCDFKDVCNR